MGNFLLENGAKWLVKRSYLVENVAKWILKRSWNNYLGPWKSPGKVQEFCRGKSVGTMHTRI